MKPITNKTNVLRCKKSIGIRNVDSFYFIKDEYYNVIPSNDNLGVKVTFKDGVDITFSTSPLSSVASIMLNDYFYTIEEDRVFKIDSLLNNRNDS